MKILQFKIFTILSKDFLDFSANSWYSVNVIGYDTEKLNIDIPLYSFEEPLELKVPVVYVLFKGNEFNE